MGVDWVVIQKAFQDWVESATGLPANKVVWGQQAAPRPTAPAVIMRIANISERGMAWLDMEHNPLVIADLEIAADEDAHEFSATAHGLLTGDGPVRLSSTGTLPTGFDDDTDYWVVKRNDDAIRLATSFANAKAASPVVVPVNDTGTGTITLLDTSDTVRAGQELSAKSRSYLDVTLELVCHSAVGVGNDMATSILHRVRAKRMLPSQRAILAAANIGLLDVDRVRAIQGEQDGLIFEPRAFCDINFSIPCEEGEAITIIESVELTNLLTGDEFTVPE